MLETKPLLGFGMEILGVELAKPLDEDVQREILTIFHENGLIYIRDQSLEFDDFERVASIFGKPKRHFLDHLRWQNHPAVLLLSNIIENDKPIGVYDAAAFWHTDVPYEDPPNSATITYGVKWPEGGSATYFADMFRAYDALPGPMKERIDDMMVRHHYGNRSDMEQGASTSPEMLLTDDQKGRVENVFHPLVMHHPITGRKALYGVAGSSFGIQGMPDEDAIALLDELQDHALQDEFITELDIKVGDMGAWDTFSTLHRGTALRPATGEHDSRLIWRISVTGKAPLFKHA